MNSREKTANMPNAVFTNNTNFLLYDVFGRSVYLSCLRIS